MSKITISEEHILDAALRIEANTWLREKILKWLFKDSSRFRIVRKS